jgi:hypothetical protein
VDVVTVSVPVVEAVTLAESDGVVLLDALEDAVTVAVVVAVVVAVTVGEAEVVAVGVTEAVVDAVDVALVVAVTDDAAELVIVTVAEYVAVVVAVVVGLVDVVGVSVTLVVAVREPLAEAVLVTVPDTVVVELCVGVLVLVDDLDIELVADEVRLMLAVFESDTLVADGVADVDRVGEYDPVTDRVGDVDPVVDRVGDVDAVTELDVACSCLNRADPLLSSPVEDATQPLKLSTIVSECSRHVSECLVSKWLSSSRLNGAGSLACLGVGSVESQLDNSTSSPRIRSVACWHFVLGRMNEY